jgi:hypothetical protein
MKTEVNVYGIPWVNCAFLCVKDDWKGQFRGLRYCLHNCAVFPSGMMSHSKIAQFNWKRIAAFTNSSSMSNIDCVVSQIKQAIIKDRQSKVRWKYYTSFHVARLTKHRKTLRVTCYLQQNLLLDDRFIFNRFSILYIIELQRGPVRWFWTMSQK